MDSMIERVRLALETRWGQRPPAKWDDMARVAIEAMREPTPEMVAASNREWDGRMSHRSTGAWQAMIGAALAPTLPDEDR